MRGSVDKSAGCCESDVDYNTFELFLPTKKMYWLRNLIPLTICSTALAAAASKGGVSQKGTVCTVTALGGKRDDVPNILEAFSRCGKDGTIVFPEDQNYWIATRLNPIVSNVVIDWRGVWTVSKSTQLYRSHVLIQ
jgi:hypothetical protein